MIVVVLSEHLAACSLQWVGDLPLTSAPRASHVEAGSPSLLWALSLEHPWQLGPGAVVSAGRSLALAAVGLPSGGAAGSQPVCDRPECRTRGPALPLVRGRWGKLREARGLTALCLQGPRPCSCPPLPPPSTRPGLTRLSGRGPHRCWLWGLAAFACESGPCCAGLRRRS